MRILTLLIAMTLALQTARAATPALPFDIPASDFPQAIVQFGKQSRIEILYASAASVANVRTNAVSGSLTPEEALTKLLAGTGFSFEFENEHSILLRRVENTSGTSVAPDRETSSAHISVTPGMNEPSPQIDEVVITGTYLRGVLDVMSPTVSVSSREMAASPYATVEDALQNLPLNSLSARNGSFGGDGNFNLGSAPNLRGIGYGATLVLVNGQRQPAAGLAADFVDLANLPWSIVDHIEVLPDGASAVYGSDAIAGVVNVILRDHLEGGETTLRSGIGSDGANERLAAQLWGHSWSTGKVLLSYQYSDRTGLGAADRRYTANADKRPLGGDDFRTSNSNPGNILDPDTFLPRFAIPTHQDGLSLSPEDLRNGEGVINLQNQFAAYDLLPDRDTHNAFVTASQRLTDRIELFAESRFSHRASQYSRLPASEILYVPSSNAFFVDPFEDDSDFLLIGYNFARDFGPVEFTSSSTSHLSSLGLEATLRKDWRARLMGSYGKERLNYQADNLVDYDALGEALKADDPLAAFNPFGDGSGTRPAVLDSIRSQQKESAQSTLSMASLVADGPLFEMPAGVAKLAVGMERRSETLARDTSVHQRFSRDISSAFAELSIPLIGRSDDSRAIPSLALSLASRYESYSDFGHTFNPRVGLRWAPARWIKFRGSWGSSFRAPRLVDLHDTSNDASLIGIIPDPKSPTQQSVFLALQGSNPDLQEETANTWTSGFDLQPISGLNLSFTYFAIDYRHQIIQPGPPSPFDILYQEKYWAPVIQRHPGPADVAAVCNRPDFLYPELVAQCLTSAPAAIIDIRMRNLSKTRTTGADLTLDQTLDSALGQWHWRLDGTRLFRMDRFLTDTTPVNHLLNTVGNPASLRLRGMAEWNQRGSSGVGAAIAVNYTGSYRDTDTAIRRTVEDWTTLDLQLRYRTGSSQGWMSDLEFLLNAANALGADPPFVNRSIGFDQLNALPYGRVVSLSVEKRW